MQLYSKEKSNRIKLTKEIRLSKEDLGEWNSDFLVSNTLIIWDVDLVTQQYIVSSIIVSIMRSRQSYFTLNTHLGFLSQKLHILVQGD